MPNPEKADLKLKHQEIRGIASDTRHLQGDFVTVNTGKGFANLKLKKGQTEVEAVNEYNHKPRHLKTVPSMHVAEKLGKMGMVS